MPRYFFDTSDGELLHDHGGIEIDDPRELRRQAVRIVAETLDKEPTDASHSGVHVSVKDEAGRLCLIVRLTCSDGYR